MTAKPLPRRILITGAAGGLGRELRARLGGDVELLRLTDIAAMAPAGAREETAVASLQDAAAIERLCVGMNAIIHLGGQSNEADWPTVMAANVTGVINIYEGARKAGVERVLFASSNHAVGFYRQGARLDHTSPAKPDSRYGLSKAIGEDVGHYYALKHAIRSFNMRIGSCFPEAYRRRNLSTWQSHGDFERLVRVGLTADYVYEIVYGVSKNTRGWWDNSNAYRLGYDPQDDAEVYAASAEGKHTDDPLEEGYVGGPFCRPDFSGKMEWLG